MAKSHQTNLLHCRYNSAVWGPSGNLTINGTLTFSTDSASDSITSRGFLEKRDIGAGGNPDADPNVPPYTIHNGKFYDPRTFFEDFYSPTKFLAFGRLSTHTISPNATHFGGYAELDIHNAFGYMMERATHLALLQDRPAERPFLISRSTFAGAGQWSGHWVGPFLTNIRAGVY